MMIERRSLFKLAGLLPLFFLLINNVSGYEHATELDRGHRLLLKKGFQIQAMVYPNNQGSFDLAKWETSNFTTVNFGGGASPYYLGNTRGIPWARWASAGYETDPLFSVEELYEPSMVSIQVGDEQVMETYAIIDEMADQVAYWKTNYPNLLVYNDMTIWSSWMTQNVQHMYYYLANVQPDMLVLQDYDFFGDAYPTINYGPYPGGSFGPIYTDYQLFRILALGGHDASGDNPIPCGAYVQGFKETANGYLMSESELRLNRFAAWTFGMKFIISWVYNTANESNISISFTDDGTTNSTPEFNYIAETNRQGKNLGPTLLRLLCEDVFIVRGYHVDEATSTEVINPVPCYLSEVPDWPQASPYYGNGSYITTVTAVNPGPKNPGVSSNYLPGDVLVSIFKPLCEEDDGQYYTDEQYFMILNGLSDPDGSCADTTQTITINFDFGSSGITSLQRLNRDTGQVENVPLIHDSGSLYHLTLTIEGGTADLFKYNTGAPFITGESGHWTYVTYQNTNAKNHVNNGDDEYGYGYTSNKPASGTWTWDYSLQAGTDSMNIFSANYIKFLNGIASAENQGNQGLKDSALVMKISLSDYISSGTWTPVRFYYNVDVNSSVELRYSTDGINFITCHTTGSGMAYSDPGTLNLTFAKPTKTLYIAYVGELGEGLYAHWTSEGGSMTFTADTEKYEWTDVIYEDATVKSLVNEGEDIGGYAYSSKPDSENWTTSYSLIPSSGQINIWSVLNANFKSGAISPRQYGQIQDSSIIIKINTSQNINSFTWDPPSMYYALENGSSLTAKYSTDGENFFDCFTFPLGAGYYDQGPLTFSIPSTTTLYIGWFGDIGTGPYVNYTLQDTGSFTFTPAPLYWVGVSYSPDDGTVKSNVNNGTDVGGQSYDSVKPESGAWTENTSLSPSVGNVSVQSAEHITFTSAGIQAYEWEVNSSFVVRYNLDTPITSAVWTPARIYRDMGTNGSVKLKYSTDGSNFTTVYNFLQDPEHPYIYPGDLSISIPAGTTTLYLGYFGYAGDDDHAVFSTESMGTLTFIP